MVLLRLVAVYNERAPCPWMDPRDVLPGTRYVVRITLGWDLHNY